MEECGESRADLARRLGVSRARVTQVMGILDVAGITGIRVRETVPDKVVDETDEIEVVDISPEALQARLRHGSIYPAQQAQQALEEFFRKGNLAALRELVLKRVALEVEQRLHEYIHEHRLEGWEAGARIRVLLDNSHASEVAIRRAWRLAHAFNGELVAAYPAAPAQRAGDDPYPHRSPRPERQDPRTARLRSRRRGGLARAVRGHHSCHGARATTTQRPALCTTKPGGPVA